MKTMRIRSWNINDFNKRYFEEFNEPVKYCELFGKYYYPKLGIYIQEWDGVMGEMDSDDKIEFKKLTAFELATYFWRKCESYWLEECELNDRVQNITPENNDDVDIANK